MQLAESTFYGILGGLLTFLSGILALAKLSPKTAHSTITREGLSEPQESTQVIFSLNEEDVRRMLIEHCRNEQEDLMKLLNSETRNAISDAVSEWKGATEERINSLNSSLERLSKAIEAQNSRIDRFIEAKNQR